MQLAPHFSGSVSPPQVPLTVHLWKLVLQVKGEEPPPPVAVAFGSAGPAMQLAPPWVASVSPAHPGLAAVPHLWKLVLQVKSHAPPAHTAAPVALGSGTGQVMQLAPHMVAS